MLTLFDQTREDLCRLWAQKGYHVGAEIGVWTGMFAHLICSIVPAVHLTCVDPWVEYDDYNDDKNDQARLNQAYVEACRRLDPFRVTILRMTSREASEIVPDGSLDFLYLDANHSEPYISQDLKAWTPKVRVGGMVCGHDYRRSRKRPDLQVADAVDRFASDHLGWNVTIYAGDKSPSFAWEVA